MIQTIGVNALVVVLEEARYRRLAFKAAILPYSESTPSSGANPGGRIISLFRLSHRSSTVA